MDFLSYPKIPARPDAALPGGPWIATEKIHGANFVIGVDAEGVRFGKRRAWLSGQDAFFGWQLLAGTLAAQGRALAATLGTDRLYAWGELYGGAYPHPDVAALPGLSAVQTGVWYAPDLRWSMFDVLIPDADGGRFLAFSEVEAAAATVGLETPPVLGRGSRADLEALQAEGPTLLPRRYALPEIADNRREGLVLKPDQELPPRSRPAIKKKIPDFDEARFEEAEAWAPTWIGFPELLLWARRMVNPARISSARSKVGTDPDLVREEVGLDVMVDLEATFPQAFAGLSEEEVGRIVEEVRNGVIE